MKTSTKGLKFLEHEEGNIPHVYNDQAGKPTIGIGHLLTKQELKTKIIIINGIKVPLRQGITKTQSYELLAQDLRSVEQIVNSLVHVPLTQNQFDAMISFTYNIGNHGFKTSSALDSINHKRFDEVPKNMRKWNKITKDDKLVVCQDLVERREREIKLWLEK